jgi:hypothetical protein
MSTAHCETLEGRALFSAGAAVTLPYYEDMPAPSHGVVMRDRPTFDLVNADPGIGTPTPFTLVVSATDGPDQIRISREDGKLIVEVNGETRPFDLGVDSTVWVNALEGDDVITVADSCTNAMRLHGDSGNDTIHSGSGNDYIVGGAGNDELDGGAGNDSVSGELGNDSVHGGADTDRLYGGEGNDTLFVSRRDHDKTFGGKGQDRIHRHDEWFHDKSPVIKHPIYIVPSPA